MTAALGLAPLRSWEDVYPGAGGFSSPDVRDLAKWNDRVAHNLLYYQTNYLAVAALVLLSLVLMNPAWVATGTVTGAAAVAFWRAPWAGDARAAVLALRRRNRLVFFLASLVLGYMLMWAVALLALGTACQLGLAFAHASLRRRGTEDKTENAVMKSGLEGSPMGVLLAAVQRLQMSPSS